MIKLFGFMNKHFGRVSKEDSKKFLTRRLPIYAIGLTILIFGGVSGLVQTFLFVFAFFLGWITNKLLTALKDYRMTLRLNRIHFTALEYDTMKRERDMALEAFKNMIEKGRGAKGAPMPPRSPAPQHRLDPDMIRELVMQHGEVSE